MGLLNVLRSGVKIADKVTKDLQPTVSYFRKTGSGAYGPTYAAAKPLHAIVDYKTTQMRNQDGTLVAVRAVVTLLNIVEVSAATNGLGISNDDTFTLPDGKTSTIMALNGFLDAGTGHPLATEIGLG